METTNPNFQHGGTLNQSDPAPPSEEGAEDLDLVAEWGTKLDSEPRSEGKLIDAAVAAQQRGDFIIILAVMRAGSERALVVRTALEALWQLSIGRDLCQPDDKGDGQFHTAYILGSVEAGAIHTIVAVMQRWRDDARVQELAAAEISVFARALPSQSRSQFTAAGGLETLVGAMERHQHECCVQYQASSALRALCAEDEHVQALAVAAGAIEALVLAMVAFPRVAVIQGSAVWALWLLACPPKSLLETTLHENGVSRQSESAQPSVDTHENAAQGQSDAQDNDALALCNFVSDIVTIASGDGGKGRDSGTSDICHVSMAKKATHEETAQISDPASSTTSSCSSDCNSSGIGTTEQMNSDDEDSLPVPAIVRLAAAGGSKYFETALANHPSHSCVHRFAPLLLAVLQDLDDWSLHRQS